MTYLVRYLNTNNDTAGILKIQVNVPHFHVHLISQLIFSVTNTSSQIPYIGILEYHNNADMQPKDSTVHKSQKFLSSGLPTSDLTECSGNTDQDGQHLQLTHATI